MGADTTELMRALVANLDDDTLNALSQAIKAHAAVLDVVGVAVPEQREDAARLRAVAPVFQRAVAARDWIETKDEEARDGR